MKRPDGILRVGRRNWLLNAVLGLVLVAVVAAIWFAVGTAAPSTTVSARTATVQMGSLTATVTGSGNLESSRTSSLSFGASGTVTRVNAKVGHKVTKGDELATIDPAAAEQSLKAARAQLTSAQASYDDAVDSSSSSTAGTADAIDAAKLSVTSANAGVRSAEQQLSDDTRTQGQRVDEAKAALKKGLGTQSQVDAAIATRNQVLAKDNQGIIQAKAQVATAKSNLAKARAGASNSGSSGSGSSEAQIAAADVNVEDAKAAVQDAQDALDDTTITAPFSGTITAVNGEVGDEVSAGSSSGSSGSSSSGSGSTGSTGNTGSGTGSTGTTSSSSSSSSSAFITMASLTTLDVTATIAEADIGAVKVGQDAVVTMSATNDTADGTVTEVSPEGTTSSNVVQYPVTVTISDPPASARLGASVSVVITTGSAENVLVLPTSAITTTGTRSTVAVLKNGVATTTQIQTGLEGTSTTQIRSGLSSGEVVQIPAASTSSSTSNGVPGFGAGGGPARGLVGGP